MIMLDIVVALCTWNNITIDFYWLQKWKVIENQKTKIYIYIYLEYKNVKKRVFSSNVRNVSNVQNNYDLRYGAIFIDW